MSQGDGKPVAGKVYICILRHYLGVKTERIDMIFIGKEGKDEWHTADDNSPLNYDWHVESWSEK